MKKKAKLLLKQRKQMTRRNNKCKYYLNNGICVKCAILKELVCKKEKCNFYNGSEENETKSTKFICRNRGF